MNGVINFYKEAGITSFKAVNYVKKLFNVSKCGHLGTLDPMAEGVLPMCIGYGARFADYLSSVDKEYIAEFKLGVTTDSYDTTGNIISENDSIQPTYEEVEKEVAKIKGTISLTVPAYSAKKINGVRAYKLARRGVLEDAGEKEMDIYSCKLINYNYPYGIISVKCGKGTYIRSIISRIGNNLSCGGAMSGLIRATNGIFTAKNSYKLSDLENLKNENNLEKAVLPVTELLNWGKAIVKNEAIASIYNGISPKRDLFLSYPVESENDNFFILDNDKNLLAVGVRQENSSIPLKIKMVLK